MPTTHLTHVPILNCCAHNTLNLCANTTVNHCAHNTLNYGSIPQLTIVPITYLTLCTHTTVNHHATTHCLPVPQLTIVPIPQVLRTWGQKSLANNINEAGRRLLSVDGPADSSKYDGDKDQDAEGSVTETESGSMTLMALKKRKGGGGGGGGGKSRAGKEDDVGNVVNEELRALEAHMMKVSRAGGCSSSGFFSLFSLSPSLSLSVCLSLSLSLSLSPSAHMCVYPRSSYKNKFKFSLLTCFSVYWCPFQCGLYECT